MKFLTEVSGPPFTSAISDRWIFERIEAWAHQSPDQSAFIVDHPDRVEQYRYPEVLYTAERLAAALHARGIRQGDRVGILMENVPQWVFALLGVLRLGAVGVPLATALPESPLRNVIGHSGCSLIFADAPNIEKARSAAPGLPVIAAEEWGPFLDSGSVVPPFPSGIVDEPAVIIYTSGTTGDPKGVKISTRSIACEILGVSTPLGISNQHRILSVLPFSHVLPLIANGLGPLCLGATVVFLSSISPQRIIEAFKRHRITYFICVPQFFYVLHKRIFSRIHEQSWFARKMFQAMFVIAGKFFNPSQRRWVFARIHDSIGPDLRFFASGGSRFDPAVIEDLNRLGYITLQAYGLTETCAAATATPVQSNVPGTVGLPIPGVTVRIDAPDADGIGEVWIGGPILMSGYYRADALTSEAMPDGWFRSGDLGTIRPDGNLVITGRSKDVIVLANGKNVYPEEVEAHYSQSSYIKEICILGIPETDGPDGEKLHAVIVPDMEEFRRRGETRIGEAIRFDLDGLSRQLPSYQRILSLSIRNEPFPRTVTRKLMRFEIRNAEAAGRLASTPEAGGADHAIFREGVGAVVAALVREIKPHSGFFAPDTNIELDLGFDSLTRVELLGLAEARLGIRIEETEARRIFTLGELVETLTSAGNGDARRGRSWKEILTSDPSGDIRNHEVFTSSAAARVAGYALIKALGVIFRVAFSMKCEGLEKLPMSGPFILCPNHQSYFDGPLLISTLPHRIIDNIFILGYTDYWKSPIMKKVAKFCNIVSIDPNVNLVRAMQVGAVGLKKNRVLLIFPEGARTIDGHVTGFKKGAAILATEFEVPLVPVGLRGAFEILPRGGRFRLHPVTIVFGDPIDPRQFSDSPDPCGALTEALRIEVKRLANDLKE